MNVVRNRRLGLPLFAIRQSRFALFEIGQRQPLVACKLRAKPVKGAPNVVGTPVIVGTPVWVVGHGGVLCDVESDNDGLERGLVLRGASELRQAADAVGLRATGRG